MFKTILFLTFACYLVLAQPIADDLSQPNPYSFAFDDIDEYGTRHARQESGDGTGNVQGSYTIEDATGIRRTVNYQADQDGFRAQIDSNEPGLKSHETAGAVYNVQ